MKKRMGALLLSFTLLCSLLLGGTIFGSAQETTSYSKEIIIPGNVDGWSGSTGGRTLGDTEVISYFNYSEDNNNYIKLNLWQLVQDNAPKGPVQSNRLLLHRDPSGTFVLNIRGKEHRLPITQTVEGYTSFQAGYMTTYEVFDFSEYNANDILLYNGAATANPDIRSIRLDYVADFTAYEWIEAEAADRITGEASIRDIQAARRRQSGGGRNQRRRTLLRGIQRGSGKQPHRRGLPAGGRLYDPGIPAGRDSEDQWRSGCSGMSRHHG